ncbi:uncharacterized protein LOC144102393 [Amblyomma americanum]
MFVQPRGCSQDTSNPRRSRRLQPRSRVECMRRVLGRLAAGIQISTLRIPLHLTVGCSSLPSGSCIARCRRRWRGLGQQHSELLAAMPSSRGCEPRRRRISQPPRLRGRLRAEERRVFRSSCRRFRCGSLAESLGGVGMRISRTSNSASQERTRTAFPRRTSSVTEGRPKATPGQKCLSSAGRHLGRPHEPGGCARVPDTRSQVLEIGAASRNRASCLSGTLKGPKKFASKQCSEALKHI